MKKFRIFFCLTLVFSVLFSSLSFPVSALKADNSSELVYFEVLEDEYRIPEVSYAKPISFYSNIGGGWKFRDFLDINQGILYDAIVSVRGGLDGTIKDVEAGGRVYKASLITLSFKSGDFVINNSSIDTVLNNMIMGAVSACIEDYPEYFWLGSYLRGYSLYSNYSSTEVSVKNLYFYITIDTDNYADWTVINDCYNRLLSAVEDFEVNGSTRYEKLKSIHDKICNMTEYNLNAPMAHQPTGVFFRGQAVCEGYAEATKLLCDRENIPCILVVGLGNGGAHKWNYIQMEDGKWYGMDVTWDDQDKSSGIYYDYFLVGSESVNAVFGKTKFGNGTESTGNHINTGTHFGEGSFALTYPAITSQSYTGVIPMWDSQATFDNERSFMFIPKDAVANQQILCTYSSWALNAPNTNKATISGLTTGGIVNITSPVIKSYTIVRHGDVDKNNSVSESDYQKIRRIIMCEDPNTLDEAQFAAADMNGDGVIDGFDAIYLDLYYRDLAD